MMYRGGDISSPELPLLKSWDGQRTLWIRAGIPQKHFQFYFPFSKRIYFHSDPVKFTFFFFFVLLIHMGTIMPVTVTPSDWWMYLTCRGYAAYLEATTSIQEYCQEFFCLDCITSVTVWGRSSTSAHSYSAGQWASAWVMYLFDLRFCFREAYMWD